ncbi:hypothetical protein [Methylorubrum podarium]|uniref:hypothetical protein n=1 Tax=Methylorubrum podarium TaxID=200476 RepID=UPI001EE349C6|nr:hypothetical protein [Methylorubrum podarium]MDV2987539.1 hypothetical protein [Methylobacteriaceae bacterium AG10]GJE71824.1 hypothetical protein CHKEEEPN_3374 [Methylorubrum podarium]
MTPVSRCLHTVDHLSAVPDSTVADRVDAVLDELERAYRKPSERIVALEAVLQEVSRNRRTGGTPFGRFVCRSVERRQERLARPA